MSEESLINQFVLNLRHGHIVKQQYTFVCNYMQFGEGDLLIDNGVKLLACEFKYIDNNATGKTARTRRNWKRKRVIHQTMIHAAYTKLWNKDRCVDGIAITNEGQHIVVSNISTLHSSQILLPFVGECTCIK